MGENAVVWVFFVSSVLFCFVLFFSERHWPVKGVVVLWILPVFNLPLLWTLIHGRVVVDGPSLEVFRDGLDGALSHPV